MSEIDLDSRRVKYATIIISHVEFCFYFLQEINKNKRGTNRLFSECDTYTASVAAISRPAFVRTSYE